MKRFLLTSIPSCLLLVLAAGLYAQETSYVSMISLIATPERYHNKMVSVVGYAVIEFENVGIFLSDNDAKNNISHNSISLLLTDKEIEKYLKLANRYVVVEGVFDADYKGHGSMKSGSIKNIVRLDKW